MEQRKKRRKARRQKRQKQAVPTFLLLVLAVCLMSAYIIYTVLRPSRWTESI